MDYTIVGKIINTHGIHGEVKVFPLTDDVERFSILKVAYIGEEKIKVNLSGVKYHKGLAILKFREYNNINDILKFKDKYIYVDEDNKIKLPEDHFFIHDLINCKVYNLDKAYVGTVVDIIQAASNDIYVVKDDINNKEYLIPAVKQFIKDVNIQDKQISIDPIEGMIE